MLSLFKNKKYENFKSNTVFALSSSKQYFDVSTVVVKLWFQKQIFQNKKNLGIHSIDSDYTPAFAWSSESIDSCYN